MVKQNHQRRKSAWRQNGSFSCLRIPRHSGHPFHIMALAYFEVGKRLMESHSTHKEMNGIDGRGFLEKARILFEEIGLKRNLGELERIDRVLERLVYSLSKRFIELRPTKLFWFPSNCSDLVNSGGGQKNGIPFQLDIITKVEYAPDW